MIILLSVVIGLAVGSFLNVVILRVNRGESLGGRSHCDSCGRVLSARELIPLVSFIVQKARCRGCGTALSWQYPIVELATAASFGIAAWITAPGFAASPFFWAPLLTAFVGIAAVVVITVADFRFQIIPDGAVAALFGVGIAASVSRHAFLPDGVWALAAALFFAALWFFSAGRWMGLGDAKLMLATSLLVGFPASLGAFLFSFWLGGMVGVVLLAVGKKDLSSRIPFGPFIIAGAILAYFFSARFLAFTGLAMIL